MSSNAVFSENRMSEGAQCAKLGLMIFNVLFMEIHDSSSIHLQNYEDGECKIPNTINSDICISNCLACKRTQC